MRPLGPNRGLQKRGASIFEVLVAMLIFSVGILGIGGLQANGLKFVSAAGNRMQASLLAQDILDRIRANRPNIEDYATTKDGNAAQGIHPISLDDLNEWKAAVSSNLTGSEINITVSEQRVVVLIKWQDRASDSSTGFSPAQLEVSSEI